MLIYVVNVIVECSLICIEFLTTCIIPGIINHFIVYSMYTILTLLWWVNWDNRIDILCKEHGWEVLLVCFFAAVNPNRVKWGKWIYIHSTIMLTNFQFGKNTIWQYLSWLNKRRCTISSANRECGSVSSACEDSTSWQD